MKRRLLLWLLALSLVQAPVAMADNMAKDAAEKAIEAGFSELERQIIEQYFGKPAMEENGKNMEKTRNKDKKAKGKNDLPQGLAKKDELPPGLAMQLQKNGALPPGLAKRNLPDDLQKRLPPVPEGYERQIIEGAAIVLVHKATNKIIDVITDVVIGDKNDVKTGH